MRERLLGGFPCSLLLAACPVAAQAPAAAQQAVTMAQPPSAA